MEKPVVFLRGVVTADAEAVAALYAHHVLHGTASYDTEPPSVDSTRAKIAHISGQGWPFLVAVDGRQLLAYAYVTQFRDRAAYRYTCENSIYVHPQHLGRGIGKVLLRELCIQAEAAGFRQLVAVIGGAEPASIALHRACGFELAGRLHAVGWKKGKWLDSVYMQLALGHGSSKPGDI